MTAQEEGLVYDAWAALRERIGPVVRLMIRCATDVEREAYTASVYAADVVLEAALGPEAIERGKARHAEIRRRAVEFVGRRMAEAWTGRSMDASGPTGAQKGEGV
jgi:hypothetical protein